VRLGLVVQGELVEDLGEEGLHLGPQLGLLRQFPVETLAAALEKVAHRGGRAGGALGIDLFEEAREIGLGSCGAFGLEAGGGGLSYRDGERDEHGAATAPEAATPSRCRIVNLRSR